MVRQFKSMNELVEYLITLEERIKLLEDENGRLRTITPAKENIDGNAIARYVNNALPRTNLFHPSFLKRAFTVWGHFFVANFLIGIAVATVYLCFMMLLFGSVFGNFLQNPR